jgi:RNA-binding protein with serine-rich domain 1
MTNRGTAYILYYDPADAEAAIAHMHEAQLDGAILNVSIVLPRRKFSRSPPPASKRGNGGRSRYGRGPYAGPPSPHRHGGARPTERHDVYRPQSISRSRSPVRSRSYSSRSRSPLPRRDSLKTETRPRRRRSPSYSSYSSRSRSPNRNRVRNRH